MRSAASRIERTLDRWHSKRGGGRYGKGNAVSSSCAEPRSARPRGERTLSGRLLAYALGALALTFGMPGLAAETITVAAPAGPPAELATALSQAFADEKGITVKIVAVPGAELARRAREARADALLAPERLGIEPPATGERARVFSSDIVLLGTRAERARVRGLEDIRTALRWVANVRGPFVASSPELGVRRLEQALWGEIGVNVGARPVWYDEGPGSETTVVERAGGFGAYALVERATWAAMRDRRGLDVLVSGDPLLVTPWVSIVLRPGTPVATWHEWLRSETARRTIREFEVGGITPYAPGGGSGPPEAGANRS